MDVLCENCNAKFRIPDEKLPVGRVASLKCPKCQGKIEIGARESEQASPAETTSDAPVSEAETTSEALVSETETTPDVPVSEVVTETFDTPDRPYEYVEEGVKTALLCEQDESVRSKITSALEQLEFSVTPASSTREALKFTRFHSYDVVVINEEFDGGNAEFNHVLKYLDQFPISVRRDIFVLVVGNTFKTGDDMVAYNRSVNFVVDLNSIDNFYKILRRALSEYEEFYRVYRESMVKTGRV